MEFVMHTKNLVVLWECKIITTIFKKEYFNILLTIVLTVIQLSGSHPEMAVVSLSCVE